VIEDQSFLSLASLTSLDLSHNGVVAISGQSLSHLNEYVSYLFVIQPNSSRLSNLITSIEAISSMTYAHSEIDVLYPKTYRFLCYF
jgi:hypothetical protein